MGKINISYYSILISARMDRSGASTMINGQRVGLTTLDIQQGVAGAGGMTTAHFKPYTPSKDYSFY